MTVSDLALKHLSVIHDEILKRNKSVKSGDTCKVMVQLTFKLGENYHTGSIEAVTPMVANREGYPYISSITGGGTRLELTGPIKEELSAPQDGGEQHNNL